MFIGVSGANVYTAPGDVLRCECAILVAAGGDRHIVKHFGPYLADWVRWGCAREAPKKFGVIPAALGTATLAELVLLGSIVWAHESMMLASATTAILAVVALLPMTAIVLATKEGCLRWRLKRLYRRNSNPLRLPPSVLEYVSRELEGALKELETPFGSSQFGLIPEAEFHGFATTHGRIIELLAQGSGDVKLPALERQELLSRLQPGIWRLALATDAACRAEARLKLDRDSYLREVHRVLGWSPKEAELRRELDSLQ